MTNKSKSNRIGLGEPEIQGAEALFQTPKTPKAKQEMEQLVMDNKPDRVKKSLTISQEVDELLDQLRVTMRKEDGGKYKLGEIFDKAIFDLAAKEGILQ